MAKSKREEKEEEKGSEYEFQLPNFDEKAFVRREVQSAKASFWTVGLGFVGGILATVIWLFAPAWWYGLIPIVLALVALRPLLQRLGFASDLLAPKVMIGSYFMMFFTGLSVWVIAVNFVPKPA
jgi:hypothetical protein